MAKRLYRTPIIPTVLFSVIMPLLFSAGIAFLAFGDVSIEDYFLAKVFFVLGFFTIAVEITLLFARANERQGKRMYYLVVFAICGVCGSLALAAVNYVSRKRDAKMSKLSAQQSIVRPDVQVPQGNRERQIELPTFSENVEAAICTMGKLNWKIPLTQSTPEPLLNIDQGDNKKETIIWLYFENGRLFTNLKLYTDDDAVAVEIKHNKFTVRRPDWDYNFSSDAFEVVNENKLPVLQIIYQRPSHLIINGIFTAPNGPKVWVRGDLIAINNREVPAPWFALEPIFKYPSWKYPGHTAGHNSDGNVGPQPSRLFVNFSLVRNMLRTLPRNAETNWIGEREVARKMLKNGEKNQRVALARFKYKTPLGPSPKVEVKADVMIFDGSSLRKPEYAGAWHISRLRSKRFKSGDYADLVLALVGSNSIESYEYDPTNPKCEKMRGSRFYIRTHFSVRTETDLLDEKVQWFGLEPKGNKTRLVGLLKQPDHIV